MVSGTEVVAVAALIASSLAADCSCWGTNGTSADYYTHYRFFDYRNIDNVPPTPDLVSADADRMGLTTPSQGGFVNDTTFRQFWTTETFAYPKSDDNQYEAQSSLANVFIQDQESYEGESKEDVAEDITSWLTLRTSRPAEKFATMSQLTSNDVYLYGTMRFAGRVVGPTGACAGFFSYALEDGDNNEADIEILTKDGDYALGKEVHYTNQPSDVDGEDSGTSLNATLASPFSEWQTHRFDWRESATEFYGDAGQHKLQIARQVPKGNSQLTLNMWSTGNDWTDSLAVDEAAEFQILWIEWAYNTSDTADATCSTVCQLDAPEVGFLSPSKFADEQSAMDNGTNAVVAIPAMEDSNGSADSSSMEGNAAGSGNDASTNMASRLIGGPALLGAILFAIDMVL